MKDDKAIFADDNYKVITELVNEKIYVLRENKNFEKKYLRFFEIAENLSGRLKAEDKDLFDEFVNLYYKTEEYYLALAFSLGVKYSNDLNKI